MTYWKVAFTGSETGMTDPQFVIVRNKLREFRDGGAEYFFHGDCVGADEEADKIAVELGYKNILFPQNTRPEKRAHCSPAHAVHEPRHPLVRNRIIARNGDVLLATPKEESMVTRSGTWSTIRYARAMHCRIYIIYRDGRVEMEQFGRKITD